MIKKRKKKQLTKKTKFTKNEFDNLDMKYTMVVDYQHYIASINFRKSMMLLLNVKENEPTVITTNTSYYMGGLTIKME